MNINKDKGKDSFYNIEQYNSCNWSSANVTVTSKVLNKVFDIEKDNISQINPIGTNSQIKTKDEHLTTVLLGKVAEHYLLKMLEIKFQNKNIKIEHSIMNHGYEEFDFNLINVNSNKNVSLELRTSFPPKKYLLGENILKLSHIGSYVNDYKKIEKSKDFYFQMMWGSCRSNLIKNVVQWKNSGVFSPVSLKLMSFSSHNDLLNIGKIDSLGQKNASYLIIRPLTLATKPLDGLKLLEKSLLNNNDVTINTSVSYKPKNKK